MGIRSQDRRDVERTRYWEGQMLQSHDLSSQIASDLALRWWHNRALHQAYGVAFGYEAAAVGGGLTRSISGVEVAPGVAYDCFGRPLILMHRHSVPLPDNPNAATLTLLARYAETCGFPDPRQTSGVCVPCCEDSMTEEHPEFAWTIADPPTPGAGVPLARVTYAKTLARLDPSSVAATTEPLSRPYLVNGSTVPGATPWSISRSTVLFVILETIVDTSAAGFSRVPCYFATLQGFDPRALKLPANLPIFTHIAYPKPDQFLFRVRLALSRQAGDDFLSSFQNPAAPPKPQIYVCWLGCESQSDTSKCLNPEAVKTCCG